MVAKENTYHHHNGTLPSVSRSDEAEKGVIAYLLLGRVKLDDIREIIPLPIYFFNEKLRMIYECMVEIADSGKSIDLLTVTDAGQKKGLSAGELTEIACYVDLLPVDLLISPDKVKDYAKAVAEAWATRRFWEKLEAGESMEETLKEVDIIYRKGSGAYLTPQKLAETLLDLASREERKGILTFPYKILNSASLGMRKGDLIIVAGRTSVGKTAFLENVAMFHAEQGKKVLFTTCEMTYETIMARIGSRLSGLNLLRRKPKSDSEWLAVNEAIDKMSRGGLHIYDQGMMSTKDIIRKIEAEPFDLVCVDYLGLLEPSKKYRSQYERTSYVSNELKGIASKFKIPMMVACQYNRLASGVQPSLAHLRDSGAIEQDADMVISLWRRQEEEPVGDKIRVYIDLLKNRNGRTFNYSDTFQDSWLWFEGSRLKFSEPEFNFQE